MDRNSNRLFSSLIPTAAVICFLSICSSCIPTTTAQQVGVPSTCDPTVTGPVVEDPVPDLPGTKAGWSVRVEPIAVIPDSGGTACGVASRPGARPMTVVGDGIRTFIVDQNGILYRLDNDNTPVEYLNLQKLLVPKFKFVCDTWQKGLSSVAFHPDFYDATKKGYGKFYTATAQGKKGAGPVVDFPSADKPKSWEYSAVHEWSVDPTTDEIFVNQTRKVYAAQETCSDHNIGQISFRPGALSTDPDYGLLYIGHGDGGCPADPYSNGQDLKSPLGKVLRLDPLGGDGSTTGYNIPMDNVFANVSEALGVIYAAGLRNPHRFGWDTDTGKLYLSDIGQHYIEEINIIENGENYGWSEREGTFVICNDDTEIVYENLAGLDDGFRYPVIQYDHDEDDVAVSGGWVYRGNKIPYLHGHYFFGDLVSGRMFTAPASDLEAAYLQGTRVVPKQLRLIDARDGYFRTLREIINPSEPPERADLRFGWANDDGEIYIVTKQGGAIWKLRPECEQTSDCICGTPCQPQFCSAETRKCEFGDAPCPAGKVCTVDYTACRSLMALDCASAPGCTVQSSLKCANSGCSNCRNALDCQLDGCDWNSVEETCSGSPLTIGQSCVGNRVPTVTCRDGNSLDTSRWFNGNCD